MPETPIEQLSIPLADRFTKIETIDKGKTNPQAIGEFNFFSKQRNPLVALDVPTGKPQEKRTRQAIGTITDEHQLTLIVDNANQTDKYTEHLTTKYGLKAEEITFIDFTGQKVERKLKKAPKILIPTKDHSITTASQEHKFKLHSYFTGLKEQFNQYNNQEGILYKESNMTKDQEIANQVFKALADTIINSTEICLSKDQSKYLTSAETLSALLDLIDQVGKGNIRLNRNIDLENNYKQNGEKEIYLFYADNISLKDGRSVEWLRVLIRPEDLYGTESGSVKEIVAQARTKMQYKIRGTEGIANIRIDPPDPRLENNIVIDLDIKPRQGSRKNVIDHLELDQQAGHHFNSGVNIADFGEITPADVHRAIANRLNQLS